MANVEGSIYRNENGVAVPYANLTTSGSGDAPETYNFSSRFAAGTSMGTLQTLNAWGTVCGDITTLYFFIFPNTYALTLGTASQYNSVEVVHQVLQDDDTDKLLLPYQNTCVTTAIGYLTTNHEALPMRSIYRKELSPSGHASRLLMAFYDQRTFSFDDSVEGLIYSFAFINSRSL